MRHLSFFSDFLLLNWSSDAFILLFFLSFCSHVKDAMNEVVDVKGITASLITQSGSFILGYW